MPKIELRPAAIGWEYKVTVVQRYLPPPWRGDDVGPETGTYDVTHTLTLGGTSEWRWRLTRPWAERAARATLHRYERRLQRSQDITEIDIPPSPPS